MVALQEAKATPAQQAHSFRETTCGVMHCRSYLLVGSNWNGAANFIDFSKYSSH